MTLQQAVFAGLVDPGNLVNVREITDNVPQAGDCAAPTPANCDTAVFAGPRAQYTITNNANGSVTVSDTTSAPPAVGVVATGDGTDTLWNIEKLQFSDSATQLGIPSAPAIGAATAGNTTAALNWSLPVTNGGSPVTGFQVDVRTGTTVVRTVPVTPGTATSAVITGPDERNRVQLHGSRGERIRCQSELRGLEHRDPGDDTIGTDDRDSHGRQCTGDRELDCTFDQRWPGHQRLQRAGTQCREHPGRRATAGGCGGDESRRHRAHQRHRVPLHGGCDQRAG